MGAYGMAAVSTGRDRKIDVTIALLNRPYSHREHPWGASDRQRTSPFLARVQQVEGPTAITTLERKIQVAQRCEAPLHTLNAVFLKTNERHLPVLIPTINSYNHKI
jgi:hypothetical protein